MNAEQFNANVVMLGIVTACLLGLWASIFTRVSVVKSLLLSMAVNAVTAAWLIASGNDARRFLASPLYPHNDGQRFDDATEALVLAAIFVTTNLGVAILTKLYRAAVLDRATPDENQKGVAGARVWLAPVNVIIVAAFTVAAYLAFNYSPFGTAILGFILLLAYPLINTLQQQAVYPTAPPQAPAEERQRVLALVEAGKITAEDAAELLGALAQSHVAELDSSNSISTPRRTMIAGAAMILVGFLLPWFTVDIPSALQWTTWSHQPMPPMPMQIMPASAREFSIDGGDVGHGLGWIALSASLLVAGLPFFWAPAAAHLLQHRNLTSAILGAGSVAMLYLLSTSFNSYTSINAGFLLALGGYAVLWLGTVREYFAGRPSVATAFAVATS